MAKSKVGELIKKARTEAGLTQEELAKKVDNVSASDISKAERGEKTLTQAALKQIAKATGVTQKSLLDAAAGTSSTKKSSTTKSDSGKKGSTSKKSSTSKSDSTTSIKVSAEEKRIVTLYRKANAETKKTVETLLSAKKDEENAGLVESLLGNLLASLGK